MRPSATVRGAVPNSDAGRQATRSTRVRGGTGEDRHTSPIPRRETTSQTQGLYLLILASCVGTHRPSAMSRASRLPPNSFGSSGQCDACRRGPVGSPLACSGHAHSRRWRCGSTKLWRSRDPPGDSGHSHQCGPAHVLGGAAEPLHGVLARQAFLVHEPHFMPPLEAWGFVLRA